MIIHVDMDAFYASVEQLDNPALKGQCVIVGGTSNRGVVSAASYEARKYGVRSAMPVFQARQKCPHGIFIPPRISRYRDVSNRIITILKKYSPLVEMVSIDEAYMDITGCDQMHGDHKEVALSIKKAIRDNLHLTCSVGVAPVRFLAKIASDMEKPDGLTIIPPGNVQQFIDGLLVQKVPGVGEKSSRQLDKLGIRYLGDIKKYPRGMLIKRFGKFGKRLIELASGIDPTPVSPSSEHKSVSSEITLAENTLDMNLLKRVLLKQSQSISKDLRKLNVRARIVSLKIKHDDFRQVTRRTTIDAPTQSSETIFREAGKLLNCYCPTKKIRLIGVGASGFIKAKTPVQMDIFNTESTKGLNWEKIDRTLDIIREKYGQNAVQRASIADKSNNSESD